MKKTILIMSLILPIFAQAKVADFNAMIDENVTAQRELTREVRQQVEVRREAFRRGQVEPIVVVDAEKSSVNVPTDKNFLRFKKEIVSYQVSEKDLQKRLANEFKTVEAEF